MTTPDELSLIETAESLLASRLDVVRPLAQLIAERKRVQAELDEVKKRYQAQLDDVEKRYGAAYVTAEARGWTASELGQMGASEPTRRPPGRPKRPRTVKPTSSNGTPASPPNPRTPESALTPSPAPSA